MVLKKTISPKILQKAYDCFPRDLLIVKLEAYEFDLPSFSLILSIYKTESKNSESIACLLN